MSYARDECAKRRLTERDDLLTAVRFLQNHGFDDAGLTLQLTKFYYVDIDLLNEILAERQPAAAKAAAVETGENYRAVA